MRTSYSVLGARKMHVMRGRPEIAERHGAGHVARCTVERLMRVMGLRGVRRAKSPRTTRSALREQCPADLVRRHFEAFAPGGLWVADIPPQAGGAPSYVRTFCGWVYVAFVTDVYSRRIIGWQTTYRPVCTDLALDALEMAVWQRKRTGADLTAWCTACDRGVQYRSIRYGQALSDCEAVASVGSKGDSFRLCPGRGAQLAVQGRADPVTRDLGRTIDAARARHRRVGPLVRAPSALTPPSGCEPPPSTKPPGAPTSARTARNNHNRQPPAPGKPASTKPEA